MRKLVLLTACGLLAVAPAMAGLFVETFDSGNEGGWTWGTGSVLPGGGNPGAYLDSAVLDTFAPRLRTTQMGSEFTGNFRSKAVRSIGFDLIQLNNATTGGRPATLMLIHDPGTPGDFSDDTAAYKLGRNIPAQGEGWVSYDYIIPSDETDLPAGWLLLNLGDSGAAPLATWDTVIQNVSQVQLHYGDPTFFFIFQQWNVGADNIRISTSGGSCVKVTVTGEVEFNQINGAPLGDANPGDPVTMTFEVDPTDFVDSGSFPVRGFVIDPDSYVFELGAVSIGLQNPFPAGETPYFVLRDNDPAVDGFYISTLVDGPIGLPLDQAGIFEQFKAQFSVTYTGDTLDSLDVVDAVGAYDFDGLTVFNFTIDDGPFNAAGMIFEQMTIEESCDDDPKIVPASSPLGLVLLVAIMLAVVAFRRRKRSPATA